MKDNRHKQIKLEVENTEEGMILTVTIPSGLLDGPGSGHSLLYPPPPKPDPRITPQTSKGNYPKKDKE